MIVTPRVVARIALILVAGVVIQVSFASKIYLFGVSPDLLAVIVISLGLLGGGVVGATCGFSAGLLLDSVLLQTLGVSSLVLLTVGYLAGRYREGFEIPSALVPPLVAGALSLVAAAALAAIQVTLGIEAPVSLLIVREVLVKALWAMLLTVPVYPAVRWALRPALIEEGPRTRGVAPTPLSAA